MAYLKQHRHSKFPAIAAVALVHIGIGYAFISGLAYSVIASHIPPMLLHEYSEELPPPPPRPMPRIEPKAAPLPKTADHVAMPVPDDGFRIELPPLPQPRLSEGAEREPAPDRPASPVRVRGDKAQWFNADDYPSAALRDGVAGVVAIRVGVDAAGKVTSCTVTQSSGSAALDEATCKLYPRRARFTPALDAGGTAIPASFSDRVSWQIPR